MKKFKILNYKQLNKINKKKKLRNDFWKISKKKKVIYLF